MAVSAVEQNLRNLEFEMNDRFKRHRAAADDMGRALDAAQDALVKNDVKAYEAAADAYEKAVNAFNDEFVEFQSARDVYEAALDKKYLKPKKASKK